MHEIVEFLKGIEGLFVGKELTQKTKIHSEDESIKLLEACVGGEKVRIIFAKMKE